MGKMEELQAKYGGKAAASVGARTDVADRKPLFETAKVQAPANWTVVRGFGEIDVEAVIPDPHQPRKTFDQADLIQLGRSLLPQKNSAGREREGQINAIRVRPSADEPGKWIIVSGERRWRAARIVGLKKILCRFLDAEMDAGEIAREQLIENMHRQSLKPIEQAVAYQEMMEREGWTQAQLADWLSVSQASVSRALVLLTLPDDIKLHVSAGDLTREAAYSVARIEEPDKQREAVEGVIAGTITPDELSERAGRKPRPKPVVKIHESPAETVSEWFDTKAGLRLSVSGADPLTDEMILAALDEVTQRVRTRYSYRAAA